VSYVSIDEFKASIGIGDTYEDVQIQMALDAAQGMIEQYTNRVFSLQDSVASARIFDNDPSSRGWKWPVGAYHGPPGPPFAWFFGAAWYPGLDRLDVPDVGAVTAIDLDLGLNGSFAISMPSSSWMLYPLNVGQPGVNGNYTQIRLRPTAPYAFWPGYQVRVTGLWGWPTDTPAPVKQANIILGNRYLRRPSAPFGIWEGPQLGQLGYLQSTDPDVAAILNQFQSDRQAPQFVIA
jgi:gp6-like head-tail connector protein